MIIKNTSIAGTLESSDVQVTIEPIDSGLELTIQSSVLNQYGRQIKEVAMKTLDKLAVENARVNLNDKGALDCTIEARIEAAVYRSTNQSNENIAWGELA